MATCLSHFFGGMHAFLQLAQSVHTLEGFNAPHCGTHVSTLRRLQDLHRSWQSQ
jgi:hypothetical protein